MKRGGVGAAVKIARRSKPLAILGTARVVEGWKDSCMAYFRVCIDRANLERTQSTYIGDVNVQYKLLRTTALPISLYLFFALCRRAGASHFLYGQKVTKKPLKGTALCKV